MFEILEHTADIGFRATGQTLEQLFANAALALVSIVMDPQSIEPRGTWPLEAGGFDTESLLVNWLNEVLYLIDGERLALANFSVTRISAHSVVAQAQGEPRDSLRHPPRVIVKGVTYHQLSVRHSGDGWTAEVYLDI